jgi:hypothetical protein
MDIGIIGARGISAGRLMPRLAAPRQRGQLAGAQTLAAPAAETRAIAVSIREAARGQDIVIATIPKKGYGFAAGSVRCNTRRLSPVRLKPVGVAATASSRDQDVQQHHRTGIC